MRDALNLYRIAYMHKEAPEIVNQAAKDVAFRAARKTKLGHYSKLRKHHPDKKTYAGNLLYAIQNPKARQPTSRPKLAPSIRKGSRKANAMFLYGKRYSGRGYIKVGWLACAQLLGANVRQQPSSSLLRDSIAIRATPTRHRAYLENGAYGSLRVGMMPLRAALNEVAAEKIVYGLRRLQRLADKYSSSGSGKIVSNVTTA